MINRLARAVIANPGANATVEVFDDVNEATADQITTAHAVVVVYADQTITFDRWWAPTKTGTLRKRGSDTYTATAVHAALPITCVAKASLVNNDYFTVTYRTVIDGATVNVAVIFEYQVDGDFVATEGRTAIDITNEEITTNVHVAVATAAAIATAFPTQMTVPVPTTAVLTMTAVASGSRFAILATENVADAGFGIGTTVTGVEGAIAIYPIRKLTGRNRITCTTTTAPTEFDVAVETDDDMAQGGTTA